MKRRTLILAAPLSFLTFGVVAQEPPVKLVATLAVQNAFAELEPLLAARAGVPVKVEFATTVALVERLTNGETADIAILTKEAVQQLAAKGMRSPTDLVLSVIGIAVETARQRRS
jgi:molybdate transport system substrate-binding protein